MIRNIVHYCLMRPFLTLLMGAVLFIAGGLSFKRLPIEAFPDVADTWVQVITQWPGHAAEEIEKQITVPIEIEMNAVPHRTLTRSTSLFGLSVVTMLFDEKTDAFRARQYVLEKLSQINTPDGTKPVLAPMFSPVGQVYWYILDSKRSVQEVKEIQTWEVEKRLKSVEGVAEVSSFGGLTKQFQVLLDPLALANYNITVTDVVEAVKKNNQNGGGGFLARGEQSFYIRGLGKAESTRDLENIILKEHSGAPVRIRNIGRVVVGNQVRLGKMSMAKRRADGTIDEREDVVVGIIFARVGEDDEAVLRNVHAKVDELNKKVLPSDVQIMPYLDRSNLIAITSRTVEKNMVEGMILVLLVLLFFLGNLRSALIVAVTIPFSLLFASILLELKDIPANLLSLGALDFGMVVDGAVVMVENIFRHKHERKLAGEDPKKENIVELIKVAAGEVERPIVFAIAIIILAYLPIFMLERVEGKLFSPMAWTVGFALLGSMVAVLTIIPVLCALFLKGELKEWHNPVMEWVDRKYKESLIKSFEKKRLIIVGSVCSFAFTLYLAFGGPIGSEFLPHLDEGSIWVRGTLPASASYELAESIVGRARKIFISYPEVPMTVCQLGRSDDGYDATGFFNTECYVSFKNHKEWRKQFDRKDDIVDSFKKELQKIPGVVWNFSQPISDNVEEMMSGVKGALVVKIYGKDLKMLTTKANEVKDQLAGVQGVEDLGVFQELGQPNVNISINRESIARYGINVSDVQDVIESALGGKVASELIDGEKRFEIAVRYQPQYRADVSMIKRLLLTTPEGYKVPLENLADIRIEEGASMIYREENGRYIAVKFSIRGRDLGSTIHEARALVESKVKLPEGYTMTWNGEFESQQRAEARLRMAVPLTILGIFIILYVIFASFKWAMVIMVNVGLARIGGVLALFLTGTNFSVSSGIGFLAVFGVSIQTGVLLVSYINQMRIRGHSIREAVIEGSSLRLRPIMMTALVATFGLIPAALSHEIGSDSQRPLAIVIVGGLVADLVMGFYLLPNLYMWFAKEDDKLKET